MGLFQRKKPESNQTSTEHLNSPELSGQENSLLIGFQSLSLDDLKTNEKFDRILDNFINAVQNQDPVALGILRNILDMRGMKDEEFREALQYHAYELDNWDLRSRQKITELIVNSKGNEKLKQFLLRFLNTYSSY